MAEGPREKPPRPRPSRPAPPRVASDNEATVFAQPKPKVASVVPAAGNAAAASVAPAPPVHKPNPDAAPLDSEHTMMMAPPPGGLNRGAGDRATSPLPNQGPLGVSGTNPTQPQGGQGHLVSTLAMQKSGELRSAVPNSQPPPPYMPGSVAPGPQRPPQQWGSQAPPGMQQPQMPPGMQQPLLPRGMMGSAPGPIGTPGPMMPGSVAPPPMGSVAPPPMGVPQQQPFRAAPPPPAPPGIVLQGNIDARLVIVKDPESARSVGFRLLRDNLLARRLPRVIAVSSALPADGKTTTAINLALALSEGARVLLLDGALSEPELHEIFGITDKTVPSAVHGPWAAPYRICELSPSMAIGGVVLPPGAPPARFERRWFEQLLGTLRRSHYDHIVFDTAALSTSPTVGQLISSCDGTLLAVRAGITTARALRRATEQIPDGRAIGVALVDAKPSS